MRLLPISVYRVSGTSMEPTLYPGQLAIGWRWSRPRLGQVVVARRDRLLVKRITQINDNQMWLSGDNAARSIDSADFGMLPLATVEAIIIWPRSSQRHQPAKT